MFDFRELITTSFDALTRNKTRTVLATLGIVIGIGAVIALISLGKASQQSVANQIESLGANLLTISPGATSTSGGVRGAFGGGTTLTAADAQAISTSSQITTVNLVSPELSRRAQVTAGRNNSNVSVVGAEPTYPTVHSVTLASGSFFTQQDVTRASRVAVIGSQVASDLFGDATTGVGQYIRISKFPSSWRGLRRQKAARVSITKTTSCMSHLQPHSSNSSVSTM